MGIVDPSPAYLAKASTSWCLSSRQAAAAVREAACEVREVEATAGRIPDACGHAR